VRQTLFADGGDCNPGGHAQVKPAAVAQKALGWSEAEDERAAIVEHDGAIPRAWAEGYARLDPDHPPSDVPRRRWRGFLRGAARQRDRQDNDDGECRRARSVQGRRPACPGHRSAAVGHSATPAARFLTTAKPLSSTAATVVGNSN